MPTGRYTAREPPSSIIYKWMDDYELGNVHRRERRRARPRSAQRKRRGSAKATDDGSQCGAAARFVGTSGERQRNAVVAAGRRAVRPFAGDGSYPWKAATMVPLVRVAGTSRASSRRGP